MKISELKKILKPLIKECVKEVLLEENGIISKFITETVSGLANAKEVLFERKTERESVQRQTEQKPKNEKLEKFREKMLAEVKGSAYEDLPEHITKNDEKLISVKEKFSNNVSLQESLNGVDVFEGTKSITEDEAVQEKGVDLNIFKNMGLWKKIADGKKE
jgi:hypothetical protein